MAEKKYVIDNAELMAEWNWEKNNKFGFDPKTLTLGSNKKVWWMCSNGHEWQAMVSNRNKGRGCPYCSGKKVLTGYNDLQTLNPELAKEWNDDLNGDLKPTDFTMHSRRKVWWQCKKGHQWQSRIDHRSNGSDCPQCAKEKLKKKE